MLGKGSVLLGSALFGAAALASSSQDLVARQAGQLDACPGYAASNVVDEGGRVTADLALAGTACNAYGDDLTNLKLEVEYQTGLFIPNWASKNRMTMLMAGRKPHPRQDLRCRRAGVPDPGVRLAPPAERGWR